jgi:ferrochelatase
MKCVVLLNLGGPDRLESVEPFLTHLFSDPDILPGPLGSLRKPLARWIAGRRSKKVRGLYSKIGGGSPILDLTRQQAAALEKRLQETVSASAHPEKGYRVLVAMRYWHPFTEEAIEDILKLRPEAVILLPLYPQYSIATTGSSFNEFDRIWAEKSPEPSGRGNLPPIRVLRIKQFYNHPGFIAAMAEKVREAEAGVPGDPKDPIHLVFSAHGLPEKIIRKGDPYREQVEETMERVLSALGGRKEAHLCFQSRVGPLKWTGPSTEEMLADLARKGVRRVLMVPVSFVSDHLETLYELDILYKEKGQELGIPHIHRVPSLNSSPVFIEALKDLVLSVA